MLRKQLLFNFFTLSLIYKIDVSSGESNLNGEEYQYITDVGQNITLPCWPKYFPNKNASVYWEKRGEKGEGEKVLPNGALYIARLHRSDTKYYICRRTVDDAILMKVHLYVQSPPDPPSNVAVNTTAWDAVVTWRQGSNPEWEEEMGGAARPRVGVRYRPLHATDWTIVTNNTSAGKGHVHVADLSSNTTYEFGVWAWNAYGRSAGVSVVGATAGEGERRVDLSFQMLQSSKAADARAWMAAAVVLLLALNVAGTVALVAYSRNSRAVRRHGTDDSEQLELVPNIIDNPSSNMELGLIWGTSPGQDDLATTALASNSDFV